MFDKIWNIISIEICYVIVRIMILADFSSFLWGRKQVIKNNIILVIEHLISQNFLQNIVKFNKHLNP